ncbi:MAG: efflux RND transporter periplasmic adaptor subunit, partial [Myxococcota bacterium]
AENASIVRPVRYVQVSADDGERRRRFSGAAEAGEQSRLSFRVDGRILDLSVNLGDRVTQGQPIATLDPTDYEIEVTDTQAELSRELAEKMRADASYARTRKLYENQNASREELDEARAESEVAAMSVRSARQSLALLRRQLSYTKLVAPTEGQISQVPVEENENVTAGQEIVTLQSGKQMHVRVSVPESTIARIRQGDSVDVVFDAVGEQVFEARVFEVGVSSEGSTTFPVTIRLEGDTEAIRPGMAADVEFNFRESEAASQIRVPSVAVGEDRDGRFVYVLRISNDDPGFGTVHRTPVQIGSLTANGIEIKEGVESSQLVVTAGVSRISDGLRVRVPPREGIAAEDGMTEEDNTSMATSAPTSEDD